MDLCLIVPAGEVPVPELTDDNLFNYFKSILIEKLNDSEITYYGVAPDNTADNQDDLLQEGIFFRIICPHQAVDVSDNSTNQEILKTFRFLIETRYPNWGSVIVEKGFINTETTIEFVYF